MVEVVIIGGGISGLATAYHIQRLSKDAGLKPKITIIEKEARLGGKIKSIKEKGFLCEAGPAGFLDNKPETMKLASDLGLETLDCKAASKKRFIFSGKRLRLVPDSPGAFFRSDLLSVRGKLRAVLEPFTKPTKDEDETIATFATRHLGKEVQEKLISSVVVGIYAGDSEKLSLKSCFPVMLQLEAEGNGSLLRAMFRRMKQAKKDPKTRAAPTGNLTSFRDGMESLIDSIKERLDAEIISGKAVSKVVRKEGSGYNVFLEGEDRPIFSDALVLALPAYAAAEVMEELDKKLASELGAIPYVPASVVCLGYRQEDVSHSLDGFGFLTPKVEDGNLLGCRWDTSTFEARAPQGHVLLWAIVGGAIKPEAASLDDDSLLDLVKNELMEIMGIDAKPVFVRIIRHEKAIPQYTVGHSKRLERIEKLVEAHQGLFITGNAFRGVGINDCTRNAPIVAGEVVRHLDKISR